MHLGRPVRGNMQHDAELFMLCNALRKASKRKWPPSFFLGVRGTSRKAKNENNQCSPNVIIFCNTHRYASSMINNCDCLQEGPQGRSQHQHCISPVGLDDFEIDPDLGMMFYQMYASHLRIVLCRISKKS